MEFDKVINERYSVRKFKDIPITKEETDKILNAGHIAPTGCNFQPQRILVLNTKESLKKLKDCTKCHFDAPCAFLVCYNKDETWTRPYDGEISAPFDSVIVATHMVLKAKDIGLGSCIVMHFNPEKMKEAFNIPKNVIPTLLLVIGYEDEASEPIEMHCNKRPLCEVVSYETF